ncbi:hypothetical protein ABPG72_001665 [Tetrahymena utriculariae]
MTLSVGDMQLDEISAKGISFAIGKLTNLSDLTLDLSENEFGDIGTAELGTSLANCLNIKNLLIDLRQQIVQNGLYFIFWRNSFCFKNTTNNLYQLLIIDIKSANSIGNQGAQALALGISNCLNLFNLTLALSVNQFSYEGASSLVTEIQKCKNISSLIFQIYANELDEKDCQKLRRRVLKFKQLTKLNIDI